jgi:hypothetical protein
LFLTEVKGSQANGSSQAHLLAALSFYFMKKILTCTIALFISFTGQKLLAQAFQLEDYKMVSTAWKQEKRRIVENFMQFGRDEGKNFWLVYDEYMMKWEKLINSRIILIRQYNLSYNQLTPAEAQNFLKQLYKNDTRLTKLQKTCYTQMRHVLSPMRASQFMQLEYEMQALIRANMQSKIPMIGELEGQIKGL